MTRFLIFVAVVSVTLSSNTAHAARIKLGEESTLNVGALLQPQLQLAERTAPLDGYRGDFFLRRIRLIVSGDINSRLSFFMDTDQPNLGKGGKWDPAFFIQDAFLSYALLPKDLYVDAGMMLAPITRHGMQGAAALSTLDYHSLLLKFPVGKIWRDAGAQLRGYAFDHRLQVRAGVFGGNGAAQLPRVAAHARWNFLGQEDAFFFSGQSFSGKPLLSVGVGADFQPEANVRGGDYSTQAFDVYGELPTGEDQSVIFQAAVLHYANGRGEAATGTGGFCEAGYRFGWLNPVVGVEYFNSDSETAGDTLSIRPGLNLWFEKHTFNLKLEAVLQKQGDLADAPFSTTGVAQLQLFL